MFLCLRLFFAQAGNGKMDRTGRVQGGVEAG